jgi:hypothetical protein
MTWKKTNENRWDLDATWSVRRLAEDDYWYTVKGERWGKHRFCFAREAMDDAETMRREEMMYGPQ